MSNWTHVAAIFRIDYIHGIMEGLNFEEIFGKECLWKSDGATWEDMRKNPDKYFPHGSEGSLRMSVWENPNKSHLAAYTVSVFGDLRDHDDIEEIITWFNKCCEKCIIRQACVTVENEWNGTKTVHYER